MKYSFSFKVEGLDVQMGKDSIKLPTFAIEANGECTPEEFTANMDITYKMFMQMLKDSKGKEGEKHEPCSDCAISMGGKCNKHS